VKHWRADMLRAALLLAGWSAVSLAQTGSPANGQSSGQTNSLYQRAMEERLSRSLRGGNGGNGGGGAMGNRASENGVPANGRRNIGVVRASWVTVEEPTPKDFRVHDLITIIVNEVSKNSTKADTKADRDYTLDSKLSEWFCFKDGGVQQSQKKNGSPQLKIDHSKEFEGKGEIERADSMTARIQAEIIDVLPNGNLIVEATHTVATDEESTTITLTGTIRSKDVGVDNTVLSTQVASLNLVKSHKGQARDATKRGLFSGFLDWLAIF
jgi:flagellar L-ring protein FlgH